MDYPLWAVVKIKCDNMCEMLSVILESTLTSQGHCEELMICYKDATPTPVFLGLP
jgi:hypothetical protein